MLGPFRVVSKNFKLVVLILASSMEVRQKFQISRLCPTSLIKFPKIIHFIYWQFGTIWNSLDPFSKVLNTTQISLKFRVFHKMSQHEKYRPKYATTHTQVYQIGRASCRERVQISVVAVSLKKKKAVRKEQQIKQDKR